MTDSSLDSISGGFADVPVVVPPSAPRDVVPPAPADSAARERVDRTLDRLERLSDLLTLDESYDVPPLDYNLPADFRVSVVMPVYNEQATIRQILARVLAQPLPLELIVVDDFSTDGTRDVLRRLEQQNVDDLRIIFKTRNEGKGAALRTGFQHATGDVVLVQDADLEYDPRDILRLLAPIVEGDADVVYGSRFLSERPCGSSPVHRLGNGLLTMASNLMTGLRLTDMETCYKAFRRNVLRGLTIKQNRFGFEPEITAKIARRRQRVCEVPIRYHARDWEEGKKIGLADALNALYCIARYSWAD